jgi:hypothetical protein
MAAAGGGPEPRLIEGQEVGTGEHQKGRGLCPEDGTLSVISGTATFQRLRSARGSDLWDGSPVSLQSAAAPRLLGAAYGQSHSGHWPPQM